MSEPPTAAAVIGIQELARRALAGKALAAAVLAATDGDREQLFELMCATGAEKVRVRGDDRADFGPVSLIPGRKVATVVDEAAFTAWVARQYPGEMVQSVRPAFADKLRAAAVRLGEPVDEATGAIIAGLRVEAGAPYLRIVPSGEAKRRAVDLVDSGVLRLSAGDPSESDPLPTAAG